ncbi:MAG: response regulator, partial [Lachnospiraceae bacterium]|nr:response regulator [Lachnospiraceae bacterium]
KSIVELMGGTIEVFSEVDRGSLFQVELELRILEEQADKQFWEEKGISRILVIDGDTESCEDIQALMGDTGVQVDVVSDIEEAMDRMQDGKENYQMVLLDWDMPELDVVWAVKELRKLISDTVPILLLAEHDAKETETAFEITHTDILTKPFFVSAFQEKVTQMWANVKEETALEPKKIGNLEGIHFLAAEDNEINAEILAELLEIEGASCEIVENGQLAVERFQQSEKGAFDAILMDVQMPVMNGHDATKAIRSLERDDAGSIPIIAMTANAFAEDEKAALEAGMNAHVAKPLNMESLKKVIGQYVK